MCTYIDNMSRFSHFEVNLKDCPHALCRLHLQSSTETLHNALANVETKTIANLVLGFFLIERSVVRLEKP
jgi:hypothetical protein